MNNGSAVLLLTNHNRLPHSPSNLCASWSTQTSRRRVDLKSVSRMPRWSLTSHAVSSSSRNAPSHRRRKRPRVRIIRWCNKSKITFLNMIKKGKSATWSDRWDVGVVFGAELWRWYGHCHHGVKRSTNELWPIGNGQIGAEAVFLRLRAVWIESRRQHHYCTLLSPLTHSCFVK